MVSMGGLPERLSRKLAHFLNILDKGGRTGHNKR